MAESDEPHMGTELPKSYPRFRESLGTSKKEFELAFGLLGLYFYLRLMNIEATTVVVLGFLIGSWLAFRPSGWAVAGIESASGHMGHTTYMAGILSSLASNMPEAIVSGFAAWIGYSANKPALLDIAVLSVLISAGFNMLLLGSAVVVLSRGKGSIKVPKEAIKKDLVLTRWTVVALAIIFALGVVDIAFMTGRDSIPPEASFLLFLSYLVYAASLGGRPNVDESQRAVAYHRKRDAAALSVVGFAGIFVAGGILTSSVESLLENYAAVVSIVGNPITISAIILGAAGALPEHAIALMAASKGKTSIALGNLIGGVLQIVLLIMGGIGIFVWIPLDRYVLFQIVVIAGSLWFLVNAISDDHELDVFEGAMIALLQLLVFAILLWGGVSG
jgi:cation:H+ antiporter